MSNIYETGMTAVGNTLKMLQNSQTNDLVEASKSARVEPFTMLDDKLRFHPEIKPIMQMIVNSYACDWLKAWALQTEVGVSASRILDSLATERSVRGAAFSGAAMFGESFDSGLPDLSMATGGAQSSRKASINKDSHKILTEAPNLSIGRVFDVTLTENNNSVTIPISVRLHNVPVSSDGLVSILAYGSEARGVIPRIRMLLDGEKDFIHDFLLNRDLVAENKKLRRGEASRAFEAISKRSSRNTWASILSGNPSINTCSAITIIDSETLSEFEAKVGGKLSKGGRARKAVFDNTYCTLIAVVDSKWETVTLHYRSIEEPQEVDFDDLKYHTRESGVNLDKVLGEMVKGNAPSF